MKQQTLTGFECYGKTTRRAQFLADMHLIVPWAELAAVVEPIYPKISEAGGRPPLPLERMLRVYFLQLWFNLSDPAVEEELYDSAAMRNFAGIDLGVEAAPDETTVCKFRHLLEKHKLGKKLLTTVNEHLRCSGIKITTGTVVDATIIGAPSSTKNKDGKRDPEMHQTAGVLPGLGQEPAPTGSHRRTRESVLGTQEIAQSVGNVSAHAAKLGFSRRLAEKFPRKRAPAPDRSDSFSDVP